jgi:hypothetical protein
MNEPRPPLRHVKEHRAEDDLVLRKIRFRKTRDEMIDKVFVLSGGLRQHRLPSKELAFSDEGADRAPRRVTNNYWQPASIPKQDISWNECIPL